MPAFCNMKVVDMNTFEGESVNPQYWRKAVYGDALTVAKIEVMKGEITLPHSHDTEEMIYVLKGSWLFHLPDGDAIIGDNQMLCISAGVEHSSEALEDTIAIDISSNTRPEWRSGHDRILHTDPEQSLWAV